MSAMQPGPTSGRTPRSTSSTRSHRAARAFTVGAAALALTAVGNASAFAATPTPAPSPTGSTSAGPQQSTPTERAAAEVRPAIVYLTETFSGYVADESGTYFNQGQPYSLSVTCTGFGVNPDGYIATAGHCVDTTSPTGIRTEFVEAAARDVVAANPNISLQDAYDYGVANWTVEGKAKGSAIDSQIAVVSGSLQGGGQGRALPARIVDSRPFEQGDVALLKVETSDLPSVELATDADAAIGTPLLSIGYPASADAITDPSLEPSNKDGQVSSKKTVGSVPVYETSAALTPGMSGGPTVDLQGRVLGVNSFMPSGESQAFNFIAPSTGLAELLSRNGVKNELGPEDKAFRTGLDAYYAGHYTDAIADFDKLLQVEPQHAQATQFRTLAAKARDKFGDVAPPAPAAAPAAPSSGLPLDLSPLAFWSIIGGAGALVVGLAVALTTMLRRRPQGGTDQGVPAFPLPVQPVTGPGFGAIPAQPLPQSLPRPVAPQAPMQGGAQVPVQVGANAPAWLGHSAADATVDISKLGGAPVNGSAPAAVLTATREDCTRCGTRLAPAAQFCSTCGQHRS